VAISPLLRNALDSLEHALDHYDLNTDRDRKFAILHADQSVELILKEKVRREKVSIYKKDKKTSIGLHEALEILSGKGVLIPESADLEMLHEERNRIQHGNSTPDVETTNFHIENAVRFMMRFMSTDLNLDLRKSMSASAYERFGAFGTPGAV
jgi:HEPN domain-containing protein